MFTIVTDSTSSTPAEELQAANVRIAALNVLFGDKSYVDSIEMKPEAFYERMAEYMPQGLPTTNCPSPGAYEEHYRAGVANGEEGVLVLTLSSGVSGTYNSAVVAAQGVADEGIRVEVLDSKSTTQELSLEVAKAVEMRDAGATLDETVEVVKKMIARGITHYFLDGVVNLTKGGFLSEDESLQVAANKIKLALYLEKEKGTVVRASTSRGTKAMLKTALKVVQDYIAENGESVVCFSHANGLSKVEDLKAMLDAEGIEYVDRVGWIGSVIGTFVGDGGFAVTLMPKNL